MKRRYVGLTIGLALGLFLFVVIFSSQEQSFNENEIEGNLYQPLSTQQEAIEDQKDIRMINSIEMGELLVQKLNNDPNIQIISHENGEEKSHYIEKQVIVKFKQKPTEEQLTAFSQDIEGKVLKTLDSTVIFSSTTKSTPELQDYFSALDITVYAEPNFILMQNQPNDFLYPRYQWNLPMIRTENGWNISRGDEEVIVAVIDTGVDLEHPDLVTRLIPGYNVVADNDNPDDDNGHGTHVAGIIASETNNQEGVAGITWFNRIMPIKVMNAEGYGSSFDIANGIIWAADHGAEVINLSLGNYKNSRLLNEAVRYAFNKNIVMIAASGNDNSSQPSFPSAYPEVLAVSAVDPYGDKAEFSNYGTYIDVAAPGVSIASTYVNQQYAALSGTSMAAPHVTALAALIRSANSDLTNREIMDIIKRTSFDLGRRGKDIYFGEGLIDIEEALNLATRNQ
ncbi:S8 family peptidase [Bacillus timonensis]|nr:S8 family peptidase [Bacillus timonensis]